MNEELKAELETLKKGLENKTSVEVKEAVESFAVKMNESVSNEVKAVKDAFELELKAIKEEAVLEATKAADKLKEVNDYVEKLDVKMQSKQKEVKESKSFDVSLKETLAENFEKISTVRKGNSAEIRMKAVGNMTLSNLTGDEPRVYSNTVVAVPSPKVNFSDLIGAPIMIDGGTYTFPREGASEGAIATQTEGSAKSQIDYDISMIDVTTDFLAGYSRYSKKMANNLPFLESFLPSALRRDYIKAENTKFNTALAAGALASTQVITGKNKIEMLMNEVARLEALDNDVTTIVVTIADWWSIQATEKSTGAGYGLPGVVTYTNGTLYLNGIPVYKASWMAANKYYVGDFSRVKKIVTEGLSLEFSNEDADNFTKNNITARIEAQIGLAIERTTAVILGDFTAA
ncbi:phage major capsid protein [Cellulophaga phage phi10:1]|uniref:Phage major capsid protein n=1 Tax=Cellulophaga phage phi10:1 TaxID=1327981 RepID=S0A2H8_9CAUD|nr:phage major capsid protein [Cellulophaga phage phi10:1]AGO48418.1 phage major capsid protein [Cellulophaga phage phi10:1]